MKLSDFIKKYGDCEVSEEMEKMIQKPKGKWMPGKGEEYWFICGLGYACRDNWCDTTSDNYRRDLLRIFKTREEAERYLEIQEAFKEASFEPDWKNYKQLKYKLYGGYDVDDGRYVVAIGCINSYFNCNSIYFESEEIVQEFIDRFGEKDVLKYIFGIEEDE